MMHLTPITPDIIPHRPGCEPIYLPPSMEWIRRGQGWTKWFPLMRWNYGKPSIQCVEVTGMTREEIDQYLIDLTHD